MEADLLSDAFARVAFVPPPTSNCVRMVACLDGPRIIGQRRCDVWVVAGGSVVRKRYPEGDGARHILAGYEKRREGAHIPRKVRNLRRNTNFPDEGVLLAVSPGVFEIYMVENR